MSPQIIITGLSTQDYMGNKPQLIKEEILAAVLDIPKLKLTPKDVSFFFPQDPTINGLMQDEVPIVILVELLFEKEGRTYEVRKLMAKKIGKAFKKIVTWRTICKTEVAVKRFNPDKDGFWSE